MRTIKKPSRVAQLEAEVESYRVAADTFADELVSIIKPYCGGDVVAMTAALRRVAAKHRSMLTISGKVVH